MTALDLFVGVDVGTSRVKALAIDPHGVIRGEAESSTPWRREGNRTETDPDVFTDLARQTAAGAAEDAGGSSSAPHRVLAVGVTSIAETGVLVDRTGRPVAPAIAWHDPRGDEHGIAERVGVETFEATTGMQLSALPSLAKVLWLREHVPDTRRATLFFSVAEWVVRELGGEPVAELSLASRTGLFDIHRRQGWDGASELVGRPLLPTTVVAGTPVGRVGDENPDVLRGALLTVAGHDHQTAAYGAGAISDAALFDSLGTAEALVRTVRAPMPRDRVGRLARQGISVGCTVIADHLCILAGLPTGITLERLAALVGATSREQRRRLGEQALALPGTAPTLLLVEPSYRDVGIAGIADGVSPAALWRSAVDDLVARTAHTLDRITAEAGAHRAVVGAGGWLANPAVRDAKLRAFPTMSLTDLAEPGAYGAALLAATTVGAALPRKGVS